MHQLSAFCSENGLESSAKAYNLAGEDIYDPISGINYNKDAVIDSNINLLAKIDAKISDTKNEKGLRIGLFKIKDSSAEVILVVWNNIIDLLKAGDEIYLENGYVRDWKGETRITPGRNGVIKRM